MEDENISQLINNINIPKDIKCKEDRLEENKNDKKIENFFNLKISNDLQNEIRNLMINNSIDSSFTDNILIIIESFLCSGIINNQLSLECIIEIKEKFINVSYINNSFFDLSTGDSKCFNIDNNKDYNNIDNHSDRNCCFLIFYYYLNSTKSDLFDKEFSKYKFLSRYSTCNLKSEVNSKYLKLKEALKNFGFKMEEVEMILHVLIGILYLGNNDLKKAFSFLKMAALYEENYIDNLNFSEVEISFMSHCLYSSLIEFIFEKINRQHKIQSTSDKIKNSSILIYSLYKSETCNLNNLLKQTTIINLFKIEKNEFDKKYDENSNIRNFLCQLMLKQEIINKIYAFTSFTLNKLINSKSQNISKYFEVFLKELVKHLESYLKNTDNNYDNNYFDNRNNVIRLEKTILTIQFLYISNNKFDLEKIFNELSTRKKAFEFFSFALKQFKSKNEFDEKSKNKKVNISKCERILHILLSLSSVYCKKLPICSVNQQNKEKDKNLDIDNEMNKHFQIILKNVNLDTNKDLEDYLMNIYSLNEVISLINYNFQKYKIKINDRIGSIFNYNNYIDLVNSIYDNSFRKIEMFGEICKICWFDLNHLKNMIRLLITLRNSINLIIFHYRKHKKSRIQFNINANDKINASNKKDKNIDLDYGIKGSNLRKNTQIEIMKYKDKLLHGKISHNKEFHVIIINKIQEMKDLIKIILPIINVNVKFNSQNKFMKTLSNIENVVLSVNKESNNTQNIQNLKKLLVEITEFKEETQKNKILKNNNTVIENYIQIIKAAENSKKYNRYQNDSKNKVFNQLMKKIEFEKKLKLHSIKEEKDLLKDKNNDLMLNRRSILNKFDVEKIQTYKLKDDLLKEMVEIKKHYNNCIDINLYGVNLIENISNQIKYYKANKQNNNTLKEEEKEILVKINEMFSKINFIKEDHT